MRNKKFEYKMYFGGPNDPGTKWNGYESYWNNGTAALGRRARKTVGWLPHALEDSGLVVSC